MTSSRSTYVVRVTIDHDPDVECPCDWDSEWALYSFSRRHTRYKTPNQILDRYGKLGLTSKLRAGTAFLLDYYEHGQGSWSLESEGMQCRWDTSNRCGILLWEHPPGELGFKMREERAKSARQFLETYNDWANGNCYWYRVEKAELPGGPLNSDDPDDLDIDLDLLDWEDVDGCGGLIGEDAVVEEIRGAISGDELGDAPIVSIEGDAKWIADFYKLKPELRALEVAGPP